MQEPVQCVMQRNADINGAINILRKVVPMNILIQWDSGDIISPERVKLVNFTS